MNIDKIKSEILDRLTERMSARLLRAIAAMGTSENLNEIRIRALKPLIIICGGKEYFVGQAGMAERLEQAYRPPAAELSEIFVKLCRNSPYAYTEDIRNGFITISGGHRVGIAGKLMQNGGMKDISALNIRVSGEVKDCAKPVMGHVVRNRTDIYNTLVISPPCAGKTTLIRDMARLLSSGFDWKLSNAAVQAVLPSQTVPQVRTSGGSFARLSQGRANVSVGADSLSFEGVSVGIVDERSEIAACSMGIPLHDVGMRTDVYDGCKKQNGIFMMLRAMSPKIIITDEIGGEGDFSAIESAMNSGVRIIATAHGSSVEDIKARRVIANMIKEGFFERYIVLSSRRGPGTVEALS